MELEDIKMAKTIFITGASSGIGKATALYFANKGWQVAATMRNPSSDKDLEGIANIRKFQLDVTDADSVKDAIKQAIDTFGTIDVLLNNAGYGAFGAFEAATDEQIARQIDTNIIGVMRVTKAMLPHFRANRNGTIINISSIAGRVASPLFSLYNATKFAIEGFSDSLQYEVRPLGIKVKVIEPGPIKTQFNGTSKDESDISALPDYKEITSKTTRVYDKLFGSAPQADTVSKAIYKAANSGHCRLRYTAGWQGKTIILMTKFVPAWMVRLMQRLMIS